MNKAAYIIAGPTASGKSDFAHNLAKRIGGTIINCDSVQIYRGIENISASPMAGRNPDDAIIDGVPYLGFSIKSLDQHISVEDYRQFAHDALKICNAENRTPIFVGGTGYYINALLNGISQIPEIDEDVRTRARQMVATDIDAARRMLGAGVKVSDPQRVARALEVFLQTGRQITEFQAMPFTGWRLENAVKILINPDADILRARIAARIPEMMSGGAMDEAAQILRNGWDSSRAIGAAQLCAYLVGNITMDECINNWITKTNQYAKRQRTWFRTQYSPDIIIDHIPTSSDIDLVV